MFGGDALLIERVEPVDFVFLGANFESGAGFEAVQRHESPSFKGDAARISWGAMQT